VCSRFGVGDPVWSQIVYPIKRWATSCVATAFLQRRSESN